MCWCGSYCRS